MLKCFSSNFASDFQCPVDVHTERQPVMILRLGSLVPPTWDFDLVQFGKWTSTWLEISLYLSLSTPLPFPPPPLCPSASLLLSLFLKWNSFKVIYDTFMLRSPLVWDSRCSGGLIYHCKTYGSRTLMKSQIHNSIMFSKVQNIYNLTTIASHRMVRIIYNHTLIISQTLYGGADNLFSIFTWPPTDL